MDNKDTKIYYLKKIKQHIEIEFPIWKERLKTIEEKQDENSKMQERIILVESRMSTISDKVMDLGEKFEIFRKEMSEEFKIFTNTIRTINSNFIYWLVGTILLSLIFGLATQFKAFHNVHECIYKLDRKVEEIRYFNKKKGDR